MADRKVSVLLELADRLTGPLRKSGDGLKDFGSNLASAAARFVSFTAIAAAAGVAIEKGFAAFDALRSSTIKLEGTAKIAGVPLSMLTDIATKAQHQFGLTKSQAADFTAEMVKMAKKAGDVGLAAPLLQKFLDIGAARGMTAAETLQAVKQSILGIDEGTDKLFGKNPSVIYAEFASIIGTTAGKLGDQGKMQALVNETFDVGEKALGSYGKMLEETAGKAEQAANKSQMFFERLGEFMDPFRRAWIGLKNALINIGAAAVFTLEAIGTTAVASVEGAWRFVQGLIGGGANLLGSFLHIVAKVAGPLKDEIDAVSVKLVTWGEAAKKASATNLRETAATWKTRMAEIYGVASATEDEITTTAKAGAAARIKAVETVATAHKAQAKTVKEVQEEAARVTRLVWGASVEDVVKLVDRAITKTKTMSAVQQAALKEIGFGMWGVKTAADGAAESTDKISRETVNAARGAVSLAKEFGAIDEKGASVLNNVITLADTLQHGFKGLTAGDMVGVIGSLAGILGGIFAGNPAHAALIRKNNDALVDLARSNGLLLRAQSTGAMVEGAKAALPGLETVAGIKGDGQGISRTRLAAFRAALQAQGLTLSDAEKLSKDLNGVDLGIENGGISQGAVQAFIEGLKTANFGQFGQDFEGQSQYADTIADVEGITDPAERAKLKAGTLKGKNSVLEGLIGGADLATPEGRQKLRDAFAGLIRKANQPGGLDSATLGLLTGSQFTQFITDFVGLLGEFDGGFGTTGATFTAPAGSASSNGAGGSIVGTLNLQLDVATPLFAMSRDTGELLAITRDRIAPTLERIDANTAAGAAAAMATADAIGSGRLATVLDAQLADSFTLGGVNTGTLG